MLNETTAPATPVRYMPYSAWDGASFWIDSHFWGRDFPRWEDAQDAGAFMIRKDKEALELYHSHQGMSLTQEQIKEFM